MKRFLCILNIALVGGCVLWSEDIFEQGPLFDAYAQLWHEDQLSLPIFGMEESYTVKDGRVKLSYPYYEFPAFRKAAEEYYTAEVARTDVWTDGLGFQHVSIFGSKPIWIAGGDRVFVFTARAVQMLKKNHGGNWLQSQLEFAKRHRGEGFVFASSGIERVEVDSRLSESVGGSVVIYGLEGLTKLLMERGHERTWNPDHLPWVEGERGPGIGVKLSIKFEEPTDRLLVLNGFVDVIRPWLYYENNRVKEFVVRSNDDAWSFETIAAMEDVVRLNEISLPRKVMSISLEIKSVYQGTKYDDTAITAFMTRALGDHF